MWVEPQVLGVSTVSRMRHLCLASEYGWAVASEKHKRRLKKKKKVTFTFELTNRLVVYWKKINRLPNVKQSSQIGRKHSWASVKVLLNF